jgi:hypothetical protein
MPEGNDQQREIEKDSPGPSRAGSFCSPPCHWSDNTRRANGRNFCTGVRLDIRHTGRSRRSSGLLRSAAPLLKQCFRGFQIGRHACQYHA